MRVFGPLVFAALLILILGILEILLLRFLNRPWWNKKIIKWFSILLPIAGTIGVVGWGLGEYYQIKLIATPGTILTAVSSILLVCLMLSLPISGIIHFIHWLSDRRKVTKDDSLHNNVDPRRRLFLKSAAVAVPAITLTMGASGIIRSFAGANVYIKPIEFTNLPKALEGFKILHLSDLHLSHYVGLDDLESVLIEAEKYNPDITLVTGDIADRLALLPEALKMIDQLNTPLGGYACLGNHEYFRGLPEVKRIHGNSPVPLMVNDGITINVDTAGLYLSGIDDPRSLNGGEVDFFSRCLDKSLVDSRSDDFLLVMSHRPDVLDFAPERRVDLILAGHTHGGQIGWMGRSLFESVWPHRYLWGHYQREQTHLYTSSGMGHWFPFRLGCPPEAPIIRLTAQSERA